MNLKFVLVSSLILAGSGFLPAAYSQASSQAANDQSIPGTSVPTTTGRWPSPEEAIARLNSKLNLTDDQKSNITPIIADRQAQMQALMEDTSGRRFQKARKAKSILSESDKKIEAVLTADQKKIYEQMKEERREQMQSRMQQRNSNPQF